MSSYSEMIEGYDVEQLRNLRDIISEKICNKEKEEKKIVWRVVNRGICYGNFREEQYVKAAEFLLEHAKETDAESSSGRLDRHLELISERVPQSEYEDWFK